MRQYILVDQKPVEEPDLMAWGNWMQDAERKVAFNEIDGVRVSTVFLGLDHRFDNGGDPILFETMIFGGDHDQYQARATTWADAEHEHAKALKLIAQAADVSQ